MASQTYNAGNIQVLEGLEAGLVTRKQLEINATRVVRMARLLAGDAGQ